MPASVAAATLLLALIVVSVGTLLQADPGSAAGEIRLCPSATHSAATAASDSRETSLEHGLRRTGRGLRLSESR